MGRRTGRWMRRRLVLNRRLPPVVGCPSPSGTLTRHCDGRKVRSYVIRIEAFDTDAAVTATELLRFGHSWATAHAIDAARPSAPRTPPAGACSR